MRTSLYFLIAVLFISCGQKTKNSTIESEAIEIDTIFKTSSLTENKIEFNKFVVDGIFLKGKIRLFDNNLKFKEYLEIDEIKPIQIFEKSTKMYNVGEDTENCNKAFFIKVKFQGKDLTVFGQDVYEIKNQNSFSTQNEKNEKLTLFPITNFKMGSEGEIGLTGCDDYSLLVLLNENKNDYTLMQYPDKEDLRKTNEYKYAIIHHDDLCQDKIYKLSIQHDTLIVGIKSIYQIGGSIFNLKVKLSGELPKTTITDRIRYDTDEDLKKMDEVK